MRWRLQLQFLNYTIEYRPGRIHSDADGLSRRQYPTDTDPHTQEGPASTEPHEDHVTVLQTIASMEYVPTNPVTVAPVQVPRRHTPPSRSQKSSQYLEQAAQKIQDESGPGLPMPEIMKQQRIDPHYKDIITYLTNGTLPTDQTKRQDVLSSQSNYLLYTGVLFHIWTKDGRGHRATRTQVQLAIPQPFVKTVLEVNHDSPVFGGHYGFNRTLERIRLKYYWPTMNKDVVHWVQSCIRCSQKKTPPKLTKAQIVPMPVASEPFERVSTDILGPFSPSKSGKRYVLVFEGEKGPRMSVLTRSKG